MSNRVKAKVTEAAKDRVEKFPQSLKCQLTADEVARRADRAANLVKMMAEKAADLKAYTKHAKGEIDQLAAEHGLLSDEVRTRNTYRQVDCERRFVYSEGKLIETRLDTFEEILERKLTEREMQLELFTEPAANGKPHAPAYPDEVWRPVPIGEALKGLPKKVYAAFESAAIITMGDFCDFQAKHGEFWVKDLAGVGPGMAEKISDAAIAFWGEIQVNAVVAEAKARGIEEPFVADKGDEDAE